MKTTFRILKKLVLICAAVYAALFVVFFFDLDGKLLFRKVEPFLARHYDKMERRDPMSVGYNISPKG